MSENVRKMLKEKGFKYAFITNVIERDNITPKALEKWSNIVYYDELKEGSTVIFYSFDKYTGKMKICSTSPVVEVKEDEFNLKVTTENSIYNMKKIIKEEQKEE